MTVTLPWGEQQCREAAALLLKAGQSKTELAAMVPRGSLVQHLGEDLAASATFLNGMAADVVTAMADMHAERGDGFEDVASGDRQIHADSEDPAGVDA